jgi:two-component system, NarL family, response regulator DegU
MKAPVYSMKKIRLLLIEDNRLLREGIISIIKEHDDLQVAVANGSNEAIFKKMEKHKPVIILLDLGLRNQNSLDLVRIIKKQSPEIYIIAMDLIPMQEDIYKFVQLGVSGFILKDATIDEFLKTIRTVAQGEKVLPATLADSLFSQIIDKALNGSPEDTSPNLLKAVRLTRRELQIITLISEGRANKEIAKKLHISAYTVKSHVHNILEKLALHSRVQIAMYAHTSKSFKKIADSISLLDE